MMYSYHSSTSELSECSPVAPVQVILELCQNRFPIIGGPDHPELIREPPPGYYCLTGPPDFFMQKVHIEQPNRVFARLARKIGV